MIHPDNSFIGIRCVFCAGAPAGREQGVLASRAPIEGHWSNYIRISTCIECFAFTRCTEHENIQARRRWINARAQATLIRLEEIERGLSPDRYTQEVMDYIQARQQRLDHVLKHITSHGILIPPDDLVFQRRLKELDKMIERMHFRDSKLERRDQLATRAAHARADSVERRLRRIQEKYRTLEEYRDVMMPPEVSDD